MTGLGPEKIADILGAMEQAGRELVMNNCVLPETLAQYSGLLASWISLPRPQICSGGPASMKGSIPKPSAKG